MLKYFLILLYFIFLESCLFQGFHKFLVLLVFLISIIMIKNNNNYYYSD